LSVKSVEEATAWADLVMVLAPDEFQAKIYADNTNKHKIAIFQLIKGHNCNQTRKY
jgi:ketol-acid reductoisomerase